MYPCEQISQIDDNTQNINNIKFCHEMIKSSKKKAISRLIGFL